MAKSKLPICGSCTAHNEICLVLLGIEDDCIPTPDVIARYVYDNWEHKPSLQSQMELQNDRQAVADMTRPETLNTITELVMRQCRELCKYEDGWPVHRYIHIYLKNYHPKAKKAAKQKASGRRNDTNYALMIPLHVAGELYDGLKALPSANSTEPGVREGRRVLRHCLFGACLSSKYANTSRREAASASYESGQSRHISATPIAAFGAVARFLARLKFPHKDVERIVELFRGMGVETNDYLRIFATMETRDAWLDELRANGDLTAIQAHVVPTYCPAAFTGTAFPRVAMLTSSTHVGPLPDVNAGQGEPPQGPSVWTSRLRVRKVQEKPATNVLSEGKRPASRVKETKKVKATRAVQQARAVKKTRTKPRNASLEYEVMSRADQVLRSGTAAASPIKNTPLGCRTKWTCVPMRRLAVSAGSAAAMLPSPPHKPRIWAATLAELCQAVPEFSRVQNGIVFETTQTPVIFLDRKTIPDGSWDGGRVLELSMSRRFNRSVPNSPLESDNNGSHDIQGASSEGVTNINEALCTPHSPSQVIQQANGLYYYTDTTPTPAATEVVDGPYVGDLNMLGQATNASAMAEPLSTSLASLIPNDDPPEINALLLAYTSCVPVSIMLCRNSALAPLLLPDGCACAVLGLFTIQDVRVHTENVECISLLEEAQSISIRGIKTWTFLFVWTPGGEQLDPAAVIDTRPWWMPDATPPGMASIPGADATPPLLPYTLLPLQYLTVPTLNVCADADVKLAPGWHCTSCGRINVQRNLCSQMCASCLTPNGVAPISVEYVRQARGTDPISIPWDRYTDAVRSSSSDGADGLRRFTYVLNDAAMVHHMFTRNRAEAQMEPAQLFEALQADVEIVAEPSPAKGKAGSKVGPYYYSQFSTTCCAGYESADDLWHAIAPSSVCQARELMLRRSQLPLDIVPVQPTIGCLTICAWRTTGHKKGCIFESAQSPVVVLCLGADVEIAFWQHQVPGNALALTANAPLPSTSATPQPPNEATVVIEDETEMVLVDELDEDDDAFGYLGALQGECLPVPQQRPSAAPDPQPRESSSEEVLMLTLVHGDVMIVHGATLEASAVIDGKIHGANDFQPFTQYSIKRTGMSMILIGSQQ
ncbi:hypothetical protein ACG7TL_005629 [Trametes sanguinea]